MASRTDEELFAKIENLGPDLLRAETPVTIIDGLLHDAGLDPADVAAEGDAFVTSLQERFRLSWQARANEKLSAFKRRIEGAAKTISSPLNRQEILAHLARLRGDPAFGATVVAAFRNRRPEDSSDEDLRMLLETVEELKAMRSDETESDD